MLARLRQTEIYFDIDGMGLVPDGTCMHKLRPTFIIHGGPGAEQPFDTR